MLVYLLSNNTFVQDTANGFAPDGTEVPNANTEVPQPMSYNAPVGLISSVEYYDYEKLQPVVIDSFLPVWIAYTFPCAPSTVSVGMAAMLTAAGYSACIS